ncbi:MAG: MFS transporter [Coriobacteriia bacterium]|nr:MFS transporter [Coriobacteriia bacterium]
MDVSQEKKLKNSQLLGYGSYTFFAALGALTWSFRNMYYALIGMNMALLSTVGLAVGVFDLTVTTMVGGIIEKVRLNIGGGGKYRPWLFIFMFVITFGVIITYTDFIPGNEVMHFITAFIGLLCVAISMSFIASAQFGIVPLLAGASAVDRTRITTWNYRIQTCTSIITSLSAAFLLTWFGTKFKPPLNYTVMSCCFAGFYIVGATMLRRVAKPYDLPVDKSSSSGPAAPEVKVSDMVKAVTTNSQLLVYLSANMLNTIGVMINMNMIIYFWQLIIPYTHGISPADSFPGLYTIAQTTTTVASFLFSMVGPELGKKIGKRRAIWIGMLGASVSAVLNCFFGAGFWALFVGINMIMTFSNSLYTGFGINYALDCGEYGLWKTGQDHRLVIMSMTNLPMKIAAVLGGLVMYLLAAIGFDSLAVQAASAQGGIPAFVDDVFVRNFMLLLMGIPAVCRLCASMLMRFAYKITDEDARMYAAENQARREAAAS